LHQVGDKKSYTMMHGQPIIKIVLKYFLLKFQPLLEKIHQIALGLLMFVLSSSWVVCIRGPEDGSDKSQWVVPMSFVCVCVCVCVCVPITESTFVENIT
jgi:hypothetical protein